MVWSTDKFPGGRIPDIKLPKNEHLERRQLISNINYFRLNNVQHFEHENQYDQESFTNYAIRGCPKELKTSNSIFVHINNLVNYYHPIILMLVKSVSSGLLLLFN